MRWYHLLIICALVFALGIFSASANAQSPFDIEFPVAALGNCADIGECRAYCDKPENARACHDWAVENGFARGEERRSDDIDDEREMPPEAVRASEAIASEGQGPGGCTTLNECSEYCKEEANHDECGQFARKHNLNATRRGPSERGDEMMSDRAREVRAGQGGDMSRRGPGGCDSKESCDTYCRTPGNARTCVLHAIETGNIPPEQAERILKALERMGERDANRDQGDRGATNRGEGRGQNRGGEPEFDEEKAAKVIGELGGPGGCADMESCEAFCNSPLNEVACMEYAVEHELVKGKDLEMMKKMMVEGGPGGCRGSGCDDYCGRDENQEECMVFAEDHGLMSQDELREMKKMREIMERGGPGGCTDRASCEAYCNDSEHGEECFEFGKRNGMLSEEEIADRETMHQFEQDLKNNEQERARKEDMMRNRGDEERRRQEMMRDRMKNMEESGEAMPYGGEMFGNGTEPKIDEEEMWRKQEEMKLRMEGMMKQRGSFDGPLESSIGDSHRRNHQGPFLGEMMQGGNMMPLDDVPKQMDFDRGGLLDLPRSFVQPVMPRGDQKPNMDMVDRVRDGMRDLGMPDPQTPEIR